MSNLIPKTKAQAIAEKIDKRQTELANHIASTLNSLYAAVNTEGEQQAILDAFGTNAAAAVTKYEALRQALAAVNPELAIPAPDKDVFVLQEDGTVSYVAPPAPEPEED